MGKRKQKKAHTSSPAEPVEHARGAGKSLELRMMVVLGVFAVGL
jgi:hypothetical protein